jgi:hypothetical protein
MGKHGRQEQVARIDNTDLPAYSAAEIAPGPNLSKRIENELNLRNGFGHKYLGFVTVGKEAILIFER